MQRFDFFVAKLNFEDTDPNGIANTVLNKIRAEFKDKIYYSQNKKLNFEAA